MPFKIITILFDTEKQIFLEEELNNFCINKKIKSWKAEFFTANNRAYWSVFIEYEHILEHEKIDDSFSEAQKILYQKLREWRKERAEKDGVPVYVIANNRELKEIVIKSPETFEKLKSIKGFGKRKIEKYGKDIIELIKNFYNRG